MGYCPLLATVQHLFLDHLLQLLSKILKKFDVMHLKKKVFQPKFRVKYFLFVCKNYKLMRFKL